MHFVIQSFSCVQLSAIPWTAACQASLSFTVSWSLVKLMSIESLINLYSYGGPVAKNLPSNAGDVGSIPGPVTKIPHAAGQPGLYVPQLEKATHYIKESAHQKGRHSVAKKKCCYCY